MINIVVKTMDSISIVNHLYLSFYSGSPLIPGPATPALSPLYEEANADDDSNQENRTAPRHER